MKVVDLHPEELIDKLHAGSLTPPERERLDRHVAQCSACRFDIAVRSDLAQDSPAGQDRPQLTFAGGAPRARALTPNEERAPRVSHFARARSRRRWPLAMLAAALVLSAGGAMAAVITGAVSSHWLPWSASPKPALPSAPISVAKPAAKAKRVSAAPTIATPIEAIASSVASASSAPSAAITAPAPAVSLALRAGGHSRRSLAVAGQPNQALAPSVPAPAPPIVPGSADGPESRADAASLFVDANRARRDGNVDRAVTLYRTLQSRYPGSTESALSRALLAQLLLDRGNPEGALAGFDRYLAEDTPVLTAEALVGRARALEQLGRSTQAAAAWRQVQSRFPGSVHARLAATRLAALGMR